MPISTDAKPAGIATLLTLSRQHNARRVLDPARSIPRTTRIGFVIASATRRNGDARRRSDRCDRSRSKRLERVAFRAFGIERLE